MQHDRWKLPMLMREAAHNVFSVRSRAYPLLLFAALAATAWPLIAVQQSLDLQTTLDTEALAGRNSARITSSDAQNPAEIQRSSCDALVGQPDVEAAGAIVQLGSFDLPQIGSNVPIIGASSTLVPELRTAQAVIGPSLVADPGPRWLIGPGGESLNASRGHAVSSSVGTNNAVAVIVPPNAGWVPACVIVLDQLANADDVIPRLTASLNTRGGPVVAVQEFKSPTNPIDTYRNSPVGALPYALGLAGAAVGIMTMLARSSEWAVYRLSGTSKRSFIALLSFEQSIMALVFFAGAAVTTVAVNTMLVSPAATFLAAGVGAMIWMMVSITGAVVIAFRSPIAMARET